MARRTCLVELALLAYAMLRITTAVTVTLPVALLDPTKTAAIRNLTNLTVAKPPRARANATQSSAEILDGRSAYINNAYVSDEEPMSDASPPLYELLQQQMEHILASELPNYPSDSIPTNSKEVLMSASPALSYGSDSSKDYSEEMETEAEHYANNSAEQKQQEQTGSAYNALLAKPKPVKELPKPIVAGGPQHVKPADTKLADTDSSYGKPTIVKTTDEPSSDNSLAPDVNVHKHKRRITFKTVSTASQFVSTPLADLMFKFSIGIAKPTPKEKDSKDTQSKRTSEILNNRNNIVGYESVNKKK